MASIEAVETESQSIAQALRQKDADFISQLVSKYHYRLLRYLIYLTSRREQAEDLIQETWLRVLDRADQYNAGRRFQPWLFSIARNLAIDDLRKRERDITLEDDAPASETDSPFLKAAKSEEAAQIAGALTELAPVYREALLLRFQEGLSLEEIASIAGAPVSTISSRLQRGLTALRSQLAGESHDN